MSTWGGRTRLKCSANSSWSSSGAGGRQGMGQVRRQGNRAGSDGALRGSAHSSCSYVQQGDGGRNRGGVPRIQAQLSMAGLA